LLVGAALPLASADGLKHKKHKAERQVHAAHQDLDESSAQLRAATGALHRAQVRLDGARSHLSQTRGQLAAAVVLDRQMQAKLDAAVQRLQRARADVAAGRQQIAEQRNTLGEIAAQNYQDGDPSLMGLSMVMNTQDPSELTGQLNSVQNVMDKQGTVLAKLQASKVLLTVQEKQVQAAKIAVAAERREAARNLDRKRVLERQAEAAKARVVRLVSDRRGAQQAASRARAHDAAVLRQAQRQEDRIVAMLKRRAARAARRTGGSVASLRSNGYLDWPAVGPITSPFGWRINPVTHEHSLHDGIDIGIPCGTPLHAPSGGRVLAEYYNVAWGNRIIIGLGYHHGASLAIILNHLSGYVAHTGQHVGRDQLVAYSGTTGWSTGCHTHFTVMANGVAVNPMNWL
jgi:murein DD-endopeptidase MepM/ murein hydrolase activator NlpD